MLATDSSSDGIERIEVSVDGKKVETHTVKCGDSCPNSATYSYSFESSKFGKGKHEVRIEAFAKDGDTAEQTLTIEPPPSESSKGGPPPAPAFYLTASNTDDLESQARRAASRWSEAVGSGSGYLVIDFGAARLRESDDTYGVALRSGTFFTHDEAADALQAALDEMGKGKAEGTLVYAMSNGSLGSPGKGYEAFGEDEARQAGEQQAKALVSLSPPNGIAVAPGGDIEPGYDTVGSPGVSTSMVSGAVDGPGDEDYYDVGTAPCEEDGKCVNGWSVDDVCEVAGGDGRTALPEIYVPEQAKQWGLVAERCKISSFSGVSAGPFGSLSSDQSLAELDKATDAKVDRAIVVFPG